MKWRCFLNIAFGSLLVALSLSVASVPGSVVAPAYAVTTLPLHDALTQVGERFGHTIVIECAELPVLPVVADSREGSLKESLAAVFSSANISNYTIQVDNGLRQARICLPATPSGHEWGVKQLQTEVAPLPPGEEDGRTGGVAPPPSGMPLEQAEDARPEQAPQPPAISLEGQAPERQIEAPAPPQAVPFLQNDGRLETPSQSAIDAPPPEAFPVPKEWLEEQKQDVRSLKAPLPQAGATTDP